MDSISVLLSLTYYSKFIENFKLKSLIQSNENGPGLNYSISEIDISKDYVYMRISY